MRPKSRASDDQPRSACGTFQSPRDEPLDPRAIKLLLPTAEREAIEKMATERSVSLTQIARELVCEALKARQTMF